jgi:hypothetical protein
MAEDEATSLPACLAKWDGSNIDIIVTLVVADKSVRRP